MAKWLIAALLVFQAHFAASYLVPLDNTAQRTFGGLLRWAWPWADGDGGPLGNISSASGFPVAGFFVAVTAAGVLILAALAVGGILVPFFWWRALAVLGAGLSLVLMVLFFGPTKLLPMALALLIHWASLTGRVLTAPR
jgi:hypothetical protein